MTVYWLLLVFPALMALAYPSDCPRLGYGRVQSSAMVVFVLAYSLLGGLRHQTGGDWLTYYGLYDQVASGTIGAAIRRIDPLFGLINWVSSRVGGDIYLVNGLCCWLLAMGTISVARRFREPWLAIVISVPYLLIVVGFGYVRQGAAIGLILMAISSLDRERPRRAIALLALATGVHATAVIVHPLFAVAMAKRNRIAAILGTAAAAMIYLFFVAPRIDFYNAAYINPAYSSAGATVRVLMGAAPAAFVLVFRHRLVAGPQVRTVWLLMAGAAMAGLIGLILSPSSTAVDRIALYFSIIQLAAFGEFRELAAISRRNVIFVRMALIALVALVQWVWLVYADHAEYWVPYKSIMPNYGS